MSTHHSLHVAEVGIGLPSYREQLWIRMALIGTDQLLFFIYSSLQRVFYWFPFTGGLLLLLQATAAREPIPVPGGRRWGRQTEGREAPGIEPETYRPTG